MAFDEEQVNKRREAREQERQLIQKQMKYLKIGFFITLGITVICCGLMLAVSFGWIHGPQPTIPTEPNLEATEPTETEPEPTLPDTVIHLVAGGDLNITEKTVAAGLKNGSYDYTNVFLDTVPILAGADLAVLNFEGSVYGKPYGAASAPPQLLQALKNAGVDLLQTANSCSLANGLTGLRQTQQAVRDYGMEPLGTFENKDDFEKTKGVTIREVQGIRIAFVAFTKGMDGLGLPEGGENCVNLLYEDYNSTYQKIDREGIQAVLQSAQKEKPDVTVALLHWGSEFNDKISATQEEIIKLMQENGVDAIIGTHSHYVQKMTLDSETGTFVAYSLGDYFGDANTAGTDYSVLLDLEITKNGTTGEVKITGFDYTPIYIYQGEEPRILRIREAIKAYEDNYVNKVSEETYSAMVNGLKRIESRIQKKP